MEGEQIMYKCDLQIEKQICSECGRNDCIGIDTWNLANRNDDWFYYCKNCDCTWED